MPVTCQKFISLNQSPNQPTKLKVSYPRSSLHIHNSHSLTYDNDRTFHVHLIVVFFMFFGFGLDVAILNDILRNVFPYDLRW